MTSIGAIRAVNNHEARAQRISFAWLVLSPYPCMDSKLAKLAEDSSREAAQKLSAEAKLNAFLTHCRLMMDLYHAGEKISASQAKAIAIRLV